MEHYTAEEAIAKIEKLGEILRHEAARLHSMSKQEMKAVREAIRIETLNQKKFKQEQKKNHVKERKHRL